LLQLFELALRWNVTQGELLGGLDLGALDVGDPLARVPLGAFLAIVDRTRERTGEPGLGFCWGLHMRLSAFGYLGFAAMSASTLRDAFDLAVRFAPLVSTATSLHLEVDGRVASITLEEHEDLGSVRDVIVIARLTGLWHIAQTITGRDLPATAEVALQEPSYHSRFAHLVPPVRYGADRTRAWFATDLLETPLLMADAAGLRLARRECERELDALATRGRLVAAVRSALWKPSGALRSPREVARAVRMSPRTLRRKLALQGSSLSSLLESERRNRATSLLRSSETSIGEMTVMLGYRSVQNFTRAFRHWTGQTPAAFRRAARQ
jgi:AraC-like DNA-binding protein